MWVCGVCVGVRQTDRQTEAARETEKGRHTQRKVAGGGGGEKHLRTRYKYKTWRRKEIRGWGRVVVGGGGS